MTTFLAFCTKGSALFLCLLFLTRSYGADCYGVRVKGNLMTTFLAFCTKGSALFLCLLFLTRSYGADCYGVRVKDGDTVFVERVDLGWGVSLVNQDIRFSDFDAWEASKRRKAVKVTDEEVVKGKEAAKALRELLKAGRLTVEPGEGDARDRYGRMLGVGTVVTEDGQTIQLADWMAQNGHARSGGPMR